MKIISGLIALLLIISSSVTNAQKLQKEEFQETIYKSIAKAYPATVRIYGFDTVKKQQNSAQFSGVVVSQEGKILTAAHAVRPNLTYMVRFPDGIEVIAVGLGRISFDDQQNMPDLGTMKIISRGNYPFAEMGWSYSAKINEPCISISYPETLNQLKPTVRFGRVSNPMTEWGFLESTCKMEPGDSGGPLFDYMGRVIGMHSRILVDENINAEVPIDKYRKYWSALMIPETYRSLPSDTNDVKKDPMVREIITIPELADANQDFYESSRRYNGTVMRLSSTKNGKEQQIYATVFSAGSRTLLVSKNSMVFDSPVAHEGKRFLKAKLITRDVKNDLVLLEITGNKLEGLKLTSTLDTSQISFKELGKILVSKLPNDSVRVSVLSSQSLSLPWKFSAGYFGANANFIDEKIILTQLNPNSPAVTAGLQKGDQVTAVNGVPITMPQHYGREFNKYSPEDTITVTAVRDAKEFQIKVMMSRRPNFNNHPAESLLGGKSLRLDGFEQVIAHDPILKADECGGPVFDSRGRFYGINIARFSRTSTLIMPVSMIRKLLIPSI
ncbi:MAG: PDZ domain-containing protein [Pedobacter sp.]|nr:MAG: PDZ domain-containing protein [Pedobacter sp.]